MEYGIIAWLVIGAIAGWLAGQGRKRWRVWSDRRYHRRHRWRGDWRISSGVLGISTGGGIIGSIIVAFIGAVILLFILRLIKRA